MKKLKTKILLGLFLLLFVILLLSLTGIVSIFYLSQDSKAIIKDNNASVEYSTNMLDAIEDIFTSQLFLLEGNPQNSKDIDLLKNSVNRGKEIFNKNLELQKANITEIDENKLVNKVIVSYTKFVAFIDSLNLKNDFYTNRLNEFKARYINASSSIREIYKLNMSAIYRKNRIANKTADNVSIYMAVAAAASILLTIIFIIYFPSYISSPISELTKKIEDISNKNYDQRINIQSNDELKTLAAAFNKMALSLKEYEAQHIDELLTEKRRMETLVTNLHDGTLLLDKDFNILLANDKICELTGLNKNELLGRQITNLKTDNPIAAQVNSLVLEKGQALTKEKIKPVSMIIADQIEYFQIILLDMNKGSRTEIKSEPSGYILLVQNITKYEKRDLAKTNLIATISHELKTPLSSINLSLKLLEDSRIGFLNEEQTGLVNSIKIQSNRILSLVNEVLDFTQVETGHIKLKLKPYMVNDIIELGAFAMIMMLNEKEIELDISIPENLPKVKCDLEKTVWVVVNLLSNSVRYSPKKGIIRIEVKEENRFIIISVLDGGPGISEEEQNRIFEKYVKSSTEPSKGTGLGLAIAKEFVEVQGGIIGVESAPGKGSTFYFTLPIA